MGSISDYTELEVMDHIFGAGAYTPATTVYIGLATADPTDAGPPTEPSGNNYARLSIAFNAAASRKIENTSTLNFPQASGPWGTISHWFICTHLSNVTWGSNVYLLAHGQFTVSKAVVSGNTPSIAANEVDIEFNAGEISDYCAHKILDFVFRNQAFTMPWPAIFAALATANLSDSTTGSTITEPSGNNYTRKRHTSWPAANASGTTNNGAITFPIPSGSWGSITATALVDGSTGGNILFYENTLTDQEPLSGDTVQFPNNDFDVSLT
jgi:hypothetical protein